MLSLRLSLSILMLAGVIITVSFASILSGRDAEHEINELFDAEMVQTAKLLELFYVNDLTPEHIKRLSETPIRFHIPESSVDTLSEQTTTKTLSYERKLSFQLFSATGKLLAYSDNTDTSQLSHFTEGYVKLFINGYQWHVFRLYSETKKVWVVTAQRNDVRQELVDEINDNSWRSALIITPIMLLLLLLVTYYLFQPLTLLERHLSSRSAQDLSPINIALPKELVSIQKALNNYLGRIASMMQRERRFSADAAHELKTPLAIIKLHSDGLTDLLTSADESIQQQALSYTQAVQKGINRMGHTVEQLLLLSRVDAIDALNKTDCSLQQLIEDVINQLVHLVADYEWQIDIPKGLSINADRFYMEVVLKNIIENACKYSPVDSLIIIQAEADEQQCTICVIDQGHGMTSEQINLAKNRFYRVDENVSQGAGLGLSICQNIVALHDGDIIFSQMQPTGLSVCLVLPHSS